jgi:hypothetical protein
MGSQPKPPDGVRKPAVMHFVHNAGPPHVGDAGFQRDGAAAASGHAAVRSLAQQPASLAYLTISTPGWQACES